MPRSKVNGGFIHVANYSHSFRQLIQSLAETAEKMIPGKKLEKIGIFLFGSPSRQEMIEESDADIMIIREKDTTDYALFRSEFITLLEKLKFAKIDIPDWGNYEDCEKYIKHSITEGNQVVEAKFIYGDLNVNKFIEQLRDQYCTVERAEKVFAFQKFYFDQYYKQRTKANLKNVKYGHGGTRDFMFVTWLVNVLDLIENRKINVEDNFPIIYKSLSSLYERRIIEIEDYLKYLESVNVVLILRNEILLQNKWTSEEGLTYLDEKTISTLFKREIFKEDSIKNTEELKNYLESHISTIKELKDKMWDLFISYLKKSRSEEWSELFKNFINKEFKEDNLQKAKNADDLIKMAVIWNINKDNSDFEKVFEEFSNASSWAVLASLCCHFQCPDKILRKIVDGYGSKKGYEYILRIISRNKNVSKETLNAIITNPGLESRYKIVAETAYEKGVEKANELR